MAASRELQPPEVEILVHVTAPSRTADDAAYRQLAQSYLSFQPQHRLLITADASQQQHPSDTQLAGQLGDAPTQEQQQSTAASAPKEFPAPSRQPWLPESQDLSFRSVYDNRFSPPLQERRNLIDKAQPNQEEDGESLSTQLASPWQAPPSQISDSYPLPDAELRHATPTRVLEHWMKKPVPSPPWNHKSGSAAAAPDHAHGENTHIPSSVPIPPDVGEDGSHSLGHEKIANIIPVTPGVSKEASTRKRDAFSPTVIDETIYISSGAQDDDAVSEEASPRAESAPPLSKRQRGLIEEAASTNLQRSSSDAGPALNTRPTSSHPAVSRNSLDALEIRPPSPPAGIVDLEPADLVPDKLAKLAQDLSSRYRPVARRDLEPLERGYWLIDCTGWSDDVFREGWLFLGNYLRSGLAGWGVWCRRDESRSWIRLYCWAHVAKHTYLLLYLASGRQMKGTGGKWIGADGEVALEVLPVEKK
ncbi:uncharacterized protein TRIREDRAFT_22573 [Trichoderma reesei QM6a]|uniref:Predicted protein n=2 Tax=Hypocrea jecorina TaxID=51453 RepID=G0RM93_HYPJQ|nr:uncharacterized protein TRIREDRAFT_22573 [Trichoderma reesei QM6a]EGR47760.1 predicted protein [Trichoderma reesei QM6a]ETS01271.1 hypothetical protein M419DRAFT_81817 [Trichoderma reesei RUT C-30]